MRALMSTRVGGPSTLELLDVPAPEPGPGQAVVAVRACGVNFPDVLMLEDRYQVKAPRPFAPGLEVSGVIARVAPDVTGLRVGDRVLGHGLWGGMAEQIALDATRLIRMPEAMPFDEAAALLLTYGTSHHALRDRARLRPGQSLLVLGAAGGVGLAAVQLGRAAGARVIAAASSAEKIAVCLQHGAHEGLVYPRGPLDDAARRAFGAQLKAAGGAEGFDVIYDAIGGDYTEPALRAIAWEGRLLVVGFAAGGIAKIPANLLLLKGCEAVGVYWGSWVERDLARHRAAVAELFELYASGAIRPHVSRRFPLAQGAQALEELADRRAIGKVVVTIEG